MANKKSRLRIQLAASARISLRPQASRLAKINHRKPKVEPEMPASPKDISVGMILRSCLASVDAMLPEIEDHRADIEAEVPDFNVKFKGCLAAVRAAIDADPGRDFYLTNEISNHVANFEEESHTKVEEASEEVSSAVKRQTGRPKKATRTVSQSAGNKTPEPPTELPQAEETTQEKRPEKLPSRTLRDRSAKSDAVQGAPQQEESTKTVSKTTEANDEPKQKSRPKRNQGKPDSAISPDEAQDYDDSSPASASASDKKQEKAESPDVAEVKKGRGRKKAVQVEEPPPAKPEEAITGPRRGRKRTRTGSEAAPDAPVEDEVPKISDPQDKKREESPKKDAEVNDETKEPAEASRKKRGRFRGGRSPRTDEEVEGTTETPETLGVPAKASPEKAVPAVAAVIRKSLRSAEDSDSADTVIEETDKVKRRGRQPSTDESRPAKQNLKVASLRGRSKKTVLKVALPIRARSTRSQAEKSGEILSTEETASTSQSSTFSLPPPPPPASAVSRSPSPKAASPRGSTRSVRVTARKKPRRNSHTSDTDTAEETLEQEDELRQQEELESGPAATSTPSTSHQVSVVPVSTESVKPLPSSSITTAPKLDEPAGKKQKTIIVGNTAAAAANDAVEPVKVVPSNAPVLIVEGKRERKRKIMPEFADPNSVLELAPTTSTPTTKSQPPVVSQPPTPRPNLIVTSVAMTTSAHSSPSTVTVKPIVTIVNPTAMANKPNITLVSPSQPGCSYLQSGLKPIVITVPPPSSRQTQGGMLPGLTKTVVLPKVITRPIAQSVQQQQQQQQKPHQSMLTTTTTTTQASQAHQQPQIRSIRLSSPATSSPAQRTTTTIISRPPPQRGIASPIRVSGVQSPTSGNVVIRTISPGTLHAPRLLTSGSIRPSIIRTPRIVTSMPGGVRPRLMSTYTSAPGARIVTVRPNVSGSTVQAIRTTATGQPNKVFFRTVAPIIPQRHITVQATPSQPAVRTVMEPTGSRPVSAAMVIRSPPKIIVKPSEAAPAKQTVTVKKVAQQIVKPVERKPAPQPVKKAAVQPRKVVNVARVAPKTVQPTSSVMEKLLEEPQLPKVGKKPLSKKQRSMRKTDLIKTSTRSRRRGTDLQINYNEDRLSKITDEDSDSQEDVPTSTEEQGSPEDIQPTEENDEEEPQDDIPVAVVEVFMTQDEVKLREVHSPTKQDLVDLSRQPEEQPMEVALGGQGAPEGFFTSEEGLVETVDVPFEGAGLDAMKAGLVSTNDNAFAKSLMLGDDALLRRKVSKRKSNPLAKD